MTYSKPNPCYSCGEDPIVRCVCDLWYVKCIPCDRISVNPKVQTAVDNWNEENPAEKKLGTKTRDRNARRGRIRPRACPVFRVSINNLALERYESMTQLAEKLGVMPHIVIQKFAHSPNGRITIKGSTYVKSGTKTAPKANSRVGTK